MWDSFSKIIISAPGELWRLMQSGWLPWLILAACITVLIILWQLRAAADKHINQQDKENTETTHKSPRFLLKRLLNSLIEILTPREWCYRQPWYLFIGVGESGKDSVLGALRGEVKPYISLKEEKLRAASGLWRFFNRGVLIDVNNNVFSGKIANKKDPATSGDWKNLLEQIQGYRPERPLDGIIINISAAEVLANSTELNSRIESLRLALWQLQDLSAFALPVYITINNCHDIHGFDSFVGAIADSQQQQIFGWSYNGLPDEVVNARLLDRGMNDVQKTLKHKILQISASDVEIEDADALLLFPHRFWALQARMKDVVGALFRDSDPKARLILRGVYFTGTPESQTTARFVVELFNRKIFAEANLAYPTRQGVLSQNKTLRRYQWISGAAFASLVMWMVYDWMSLDEQLRTIDHSLRTMHRFEQTSHQEERVYSLIREMSNMNAGSLARATIPASWGGVDHQISHYLAEEYFQAIIFPALETQLIRKGNRLAQQAPEISVENQTTNIAVFESWLADIAEFTRQMHRFHQLSNGETLHDQTDVLKGFADIMQYAFHRPMPVEFTQNSDLYDIALREVCYPENKAGSCTGDNATIDKFIADFETRVSSTLLSVSEAVQQSFRHNERYQGELFTSLQQLDIVSSPELVRQLPSQLLEFASWYDAVSTRWLQIDGNDPCESLSSQLINFKKTNQLSGKNRKTVDSALQFFDEQSCRDPAVQSLLSAQYPQIGGLMAPRDSGVPQFAEDIMIFRKAIGGIHKLPFFTAASATGPIFVGDDYYWDSKQLSQVHEFFKAYQDFKAEYADSKPNRHTINLGDTAALALLHTAMQYTVSASQLSKSEALGVLPGLNSSTRPLSARQRDLESRISHFKIASATLSQIPALYIQMGYPESAEKLSQVTKNYSMTLLKQVDEMAVAARLYQPRETASIDQSNMAATLFGLGTVPLVKDYLFNQAQAIQNLSLNMATPILDFIIANQSFGYTPLTYQEHHLFSKWRETAVEIDKAQLSNTNNNKQRLEDFFVNELAQLAPQNCLTALPAINSAIGLDVFSTAQRHIAEQVSLTCKSDNLSELKAGYRKLAAEFNSTLSGKFPFSGTGASNDAFAEAAFADVHSFFGSYETDYRTIVTRLLAASEGQTQYTELRQFLNELENTADFFADNLAKAQPFDQSSIEVGIRFRALDRVGSEASQIVNWEMAVGNQSLTSPGLDQTVFWRFGASARLTLRWSEDANTLPSQNPPEIHIGGQQPQITDRSAVFEAGGNWALLRLIQQQRSAMKDPLLPATSPEVVLGFSVGQLTKSDSAMATPATVYLRMALYATAADSGRKYLLKIPARFPVAAPTI